MEQYQACHQSFGTISYPRLVVVFVLEIYIQVLLRLHPRLLPNQALGQIEHLV